MTLTTLLPYILQIIEDATGSKWGPLMILVSGWIVQLLSDDSRFPISLPKSWDSNVWKPVAVVVASTVQAVIAGIIQKHVDPVHAILMGLQTAMWTLGLWSLVIKAAFGGKVPTWLNYLALILPPAPTPTLGHPLGVDRDAVTLPVLPSKKETKP